MKIFHLKIRRYFHIIAVLVTLTCVYYMKNYKDWTFIEHFSDPTRLSYKKFQENEEKNSFSSSKILRSSSSGTISVAIKSSTSGTISVPIKSSTSGTINVPIKSSTSGTINVPIKSSTSGVASVPPPFDCSDWTLPDINKINEKSSISLDPEKFLYPGLLWGPNNQIMGLKHAVYVAIRLNR